MPLIVEFSNGVVDDVLLGEPGKRVLGEMMVRICISYKANGVSNWFVSTIEQFERIQRNKAELPIHRSGEIIKITKGRCTLAAEGLKREE